MMFVFTLYVLKFTSVHNIVVDDTRSYLLYSLKLVFKSLSNLSPLLYYSNGTKRNEYN